MKAGEFRSVLEGAVSGEMAAFEALVELYDHLICKYSRIRGGIDADLRQHLLVHVLLHIHEFQVEYQAEEK